MSEVIIVKKHQVMLVPQHMCVGANFKGFKYKMVSYQMRDYIMLDWSLDTCRLLAMLGVKIESPMNIEYTWPGQYTPFDHQRVTSDFMAQNLRSFIFNDIGTGKTMSALWAADYLMKRGEVNKVLITSTLSTLNRVWESEIFNNLMHRTCAVLHGTPKKRKKLLAEAHDFYIINHAGLKVLESELRNRPDINLVIADEGAIFRNKKTGLWEAMYSLANENTNRALWWMTGSPMPRSPTDAWAQARIVNPKTVSQYFSRFRDKTMFKINQFKWAPRSGWEDIAYSALKPSIRYHRDDCIDLPACTYIKHEVAMSPDQVIAYNSLKDQFIAQMKEGLITAANEGVKLLKLLQVACGAVYTDDGSVGMLTCTHKLHELDQIMIEAGSKIIIFVPFKHSITVLTDWVQKKHPTLKYGIVNGDVSMKRRDEVFKDFQDGDLEAIIAHPKAMAHGLTLTAANVITWWGPIDDYEIYEQANGRITRPGQQRKQYIKHLICSPVEKAVYSRLKRKESMQGLLLDLIRN